MPTVYFEESDAPLDSWEFAEFLYLFRAAYSRSLDIVGSNEKEVLDNAEKYHEVFSESFAVEMPEKVITELFHTDRGGAELRLNSINKSSPLEIAFIAVVPALVLAVIVSGGKIDININRVGHIKCTLPPLATTIENLRKACRSKPRGKGK